MLPNRTLRKLRSGGVAVGSFLRYTNAGLAEYLALIGLDFIVLDGEHGPLSPATCEHMVRAIQLRGATPLVRVHENSPPTILRYLDTGAEGVHVPGVSSAQDAARAVQSAKYYPMGTRGLSSSRASSYGVLDSFAEYVQDANESTQVVVQIETSAGVDAAQDIAAVPGVDVVLVGTLDLSQDYGFPGDTGRPEIRKAIEQVSDAAHQNGKMLGSVATSVDDAERQVDAGSTYVVLTVEALLKPSARRLCEIANSTLGI